MAYPTRPVLDGIIDPDWGQWVHDTDAGIALTTYALSGSAAPAVGTAAVISGPGPLALALPTLLIASLHADVTVTGVDMVLFLTTHTSSPPSTESVPPTAPHRMGRARVGNDTVATTAILSLAAGNHWFGVYAATTASGGNLTIGGTESYLSVLAIPNPNR